LNRTTAKSATLTVRVSPDIKDLLTKAAVADRRSLANMLEVMVLDYCQRAGISAPPKTVPSRKVRK
jgi:uncharacterized protein (DUF1778 family)